MRSLQLDFPSMLRRGLGNVRAMGSLQATKSVRATGRKKKHSTAIPCRKAFPNAISIMGMAGVRAERREDDNHEQHLFERRREVVELAEGGSLAAPTTGGVTLARKRWWGSVVARERAGRWGLTGGPGSSVASAASGLSTPASGAGVGPASVACTSDAATGRGCTS